MSDHIDGPRSIGDPPVDVTDLFAFQSPADATHTVFVANFFPFAGETALFSNAAHYSIVLRRVRQTGIGSDAGFKPVAGPAFRFTFQFEVLEPSTNGTPHAQKGLCTLPDGRSLSLTVGQDQGIATPDGAVRVFAGLRSDPFFVGWLRDGSWKPISNLIEGDNVLSIVLELETKLLHPELGSLFGAIAETTSRASPKEGAASFQRYDWVGRPEQTNFILFMPGQIDLSDLWNQQTPFALDDALVPVFRKRLTDSLRQWDRHDDTLEWDDAALNAHVNVRLDDFLLIDVAKPTHDTSYLDIEKSAIEGRPYTTGGGRTLNAKDIDMLVTWLVNRDQGPFWQSPATQATKLAGTTFPYVASPNVKLSHITRHVDLQASPQTVWAVVGEFGGLWHPLVGSLQLIGQGIGQLRRIETIDGKIIVERLAARDAAHRILEYTMVSGIPVDIYEGQLSVVAQGSGSTLTWSVAFRHAGLADMIVNIIISTLIDTGLAALKTRFDSGA